MKKFWQLWLTAVFAALLLTACGTSDEPKKEDATEQTGGKTAGDAEQAAPAFPVTLTDAVGNEITFEEAPKKIVSLQASNTEILFALGLNEEIVGVTDFDNYPEEALEKEKVGGMQFNVEQIIAMGPDVVFANEMGQSSGEEGWQQIRDAGIQVFVVKNAMNFDETYETIKTIGEATGKTEEAEKIVADMKAKVDEVVAKTKDVETKKRVFVETSDAPDIYAPGKGTFMQEMLDMIGAENVVTADGWALISPEEIVKQNPDVIIVMYSYVPDIVESVKNRDGFSDITAVKEDRVIQVDENMTSRTGPRLALGLEEVAKAIYPEAFGE
ncbi:putative ABC transporter substrate-binding lipoprotein YvrC [Sporosarcina sp. NCCP-2222]|uniref:ABC transporter substrate-binding protein n=1 Tax=Sporosarcina sp. NCCP-2222 TaxID=2935073 RepID=UPI002084BFD5|nr:ABC transporter substrate-binding protein [Sporosarcina sp. NCCP-2222]GKV57877.1 putative ABC transporter substrate-binding lipoprotein YvrC [Sporosarcina sp. NCCP-2222]